MVDEPVDSAIEGFGGEGGPAVGGQDFPVGGCDVCAKGLFVQPFGGNKEMGSEPCETDAGRNEIRRDIRQIAADERPFDEARLQEYQAKPLSDAGGQKDVCSRQVFAVGQPRRTACFEGPGQTDRGREFLPARIAGLLYGVQGWKRHCKRRPTVYQRGPEQRFSQVLPSNAAHRVEYETVTGGDTQAFLEFPPGVAPGR